MTDRLAELGALQYAVENLSTAGTNPNRLGLAGYIHAAYTDYQTWAAANPGVNPNRLSAKGRLYGYFYDHASWSPLSLFASSEVGAWYDPSDLSTMFQDRAGSTPVTADGQTVGLILDKSKGLALGTELVTNAADREFSSDTGFWSKEGSATISGGVVNINNPTGTAAIYRFNFPNEPGGYYEISFDINLSAGSMEVILNAAVPVPITGGNGRKTLRIYRSTLTTFGIRTVGATTAVGTIDNLTIKRIEGNHAVAPSDAARPLYKTDGTYRWLQFDGVDDSLSTSAINFTGTDKMSVFSGSYKASNAAAALMYELSSNINANNGSMYNSSPENVTGEERSTSKGTSIASYIRSSVSVEKRVLTETRNISAPIVSLRRNGSLIGSDTSTQGTGNFGNYPLYIGSRAVTSLYFNGNIYSLIVRGALSTTDEITNTETWVNSKTGAF